MAIDRKSSGDHTDGDYADSCVWPVCAVAVHSSRFDRRPLEVEKDRAKHMVAEA